MRRIVGVLLLAGGSSCLLCAVSVFGAHYECYRAAQDAGHNTECDDCFNVVTGGVVTASYRCVPGQGSTFVPATYCNTAATEDGWVCMDTPESCGGTKWLHQGVANCNSVGEDTDDECPTSYTKSTEMDLGDEPDCSVAGNNLRRFVRALALVARAVP